MNNSETLDKYKGCLIGLALGDALGVPFEFWKRENVIKYLENNNFELKDFLYGRIKHKKGFYSDDTSMTICLAESLIEKGFDLNDQFFRYKKWLISGYATPNDDSSYGAGQHTFKILGTEQINENLDGNDSKGGGNGSLMRCAPIGLYYANDYEEIKNKSLLSSYITHNYYVSGWCCVVLNTMISLILNGYKKEELLTKIIEIYNGNIPSEIIELLKIDYSNITDFNYNITGYSLYTLRVAIWSFLTTNNYLDSIKKVVLLGNDTDTFAAVTGSISGCYYGYTNIQYDYKNNVMKHDYIVNLAELIYNKINNNIN